MTILLIIHAFITLALIGVILLQKSEGGGLGMGGSNSSGSMFTARGATNLLTRVTAILVTIFFANCLLMGVISKKQIKQSTSFLEVTTQPTAPTAETTAPTVPAEPKAP